jgi:ribonuclease HIII
VVFLKLVLKLTNEEVKRIVHFYQDYHADSKNESVFFLAKTDFVTVTVYSTNKVQFQGSDAKEEYTMWCHMLGKELPTGNDVKTVTKASNDYYEVSIGSDEVGTGDFFGPITVCAAYLNKEAVSFVKGLGIKDSKKLTDQKILQIGEQIKDKVTFSLLTLHNDKFNDLFEKGFNMNKMKAYLHNKAIASLVNKLDHKPKVILDQFAEEKLYFSYLKDEHPVYRDIIFTTKAEDKYASVAIGSIIARYAFLKHFDLLSESSGYDLLKGAGKKVDILVSQIIKEKGEGFLRNIAKINFRTISKAKELI